jgi:hypothetical protein
MVPYKNIWYFWHINYPNYNARMLKMADYVQNSYLHKYLVNKLQLVPKD